MSMSMNESSRGQTEVELNEHFPILLFHMTPSDRSKIEIGKNLIRRLDLSHERRGLSIHLYCENRKSCAVSFDGPYAMRTHSGKPS